MLGLASCRNQLARNVQVVSLMYGFRNADQSIFRSNEADVAREMSDCMSTLR
jgi:hypothetical protein